MRESVPLPMDSRYATFSFTASTSRNCSVSAPGTTPACHVLPPSVVRVNVPSLPLAQTTRSFTGLPAMSPLTVALFWGSIATRDRATELALLRGGGVQRAGRRVNNVLPSCSLPAFRRLVGQGNPRVRAGNARRVFRDDALRGIAAEFRIREERLVAAFAP